MIRSFFKATDQFSDPAAKRIILIGTAVAVIVFAALWGTIGYLLANTTLFDIGWLETVFDFLGGAATVVLTWLLFPAVISAVIGFFLDDIARAVELRHYPELGPAQGLNATASLATSLRFLAVLVLLNLLMLPFLLTGPLFPFIYYAVNGYLLSREYFELVALRRLPPAEAQALRRAQGLKLFPAGVAIAFLLTIPVVNLLAPILATGWMVHLYQRARQRQGAT